MSLLRMPTLPAVPVLELVLELLLVLVLVLEQALALVPQTWTRWLLQ